jgi:DNA-binding HxlR family transcriptional regulator
MIIMGKVFLGKIILGLDFRHGLSDDRIRWGIPPWTYKEEGDYKKDILKIKKVLSIPTKEEIIKIIFAFKSINFKNLETAMKLSHSTMWDFIEELSDVGLIKKEKIKIEGERKEYKLTIHPNVEIIQLKTLGPAEGDTEIVSLYEENWNIDELKPEFEKLKQEGKVKDNTLIMNKVGEKESPSIILTYKQHIENKIKIKRKQGK